MAAPKKLNGRIVNDEREAFPTSQGTIHRQRLLLRSSLCDRGEPVKFAITPHFGSDRL
ncbi:hypothetical protein [Phormidesmis priestleyi]